ncbi:MAG: ribosome biogenesis GTP-binding protein YihA/YsxC [Lachnospiraceae bacterium]|nr:ribosome biogenesis GTP-binding protein YihA/YsxC [Lachnospiraceae bacterium]
MVIKQVALETVCGITSTLPKNQMPEIAFAGKSNVGKSSLINGLMNRKSLARTSATPGKTQTINYYRINDDCYFVDLPGYGYANTSREVKAKWGKMIERYLRTSDKLRAVFLLVDIRHEPGKNDVQMYRWIKESGFEPVVIATKADKIKRSKLAEQYRILRKGLGMPAEGLLLPYSALSKQGREEIYEVIDGILAAECRDDGVLQDES